MSAKGRAKWTYGQMPSLLGQMSIGPFGERSEPGNPKGFRVSARNLQKPSVFRVSARRLRKPLGFTRSLLENRNKAFLCNTRLHICIYDWKDEKKYG